MFERFLIKHKWLRPLWGKKINFCPNFLTATFFKSQTVKKKLGLILTIIKVLFISIIFAKETKGPSLTSSAPDLSQNFTPGV
jgi:hypothetical protein